MTNAALRALRALTAAAVVLAVVPQAGAAQRAFVSGAGSDANPCSITAPCRGFTAAIAAVNDGGEVIVLDTAGYGTVTIAKSVSVTAPRGIYAGITAPNNSVAITITGGGVVTLRGLTIIGNGGAYGIDAQNVARLHIEDVSVTGFNRGLFVSSPGTLVVRHSNFQGNFEVGIHVEPATGTSLATVENSFFIGNGANGLVFAGITRGAVSGSEAVNNGNVGLLIDAGAHASISDCRVTRTPDNFTRWGIMVRGTGTRAQISRCEIIGPANGVHALNGAYAGISDTTALASDAFSYAGFYVDTGASMDVERSAAYGFGIGGFMASNASFGEATPTMRVSNSVATGNYSGLYNNGGNGIFETRGNNTVRGNAQGLYAPWYTIIGGN